MTTQHPHIRTSNSGPVECTKRFFCLGQHGTQYGGQKRHLKKCRETSDLQEDLPRLPKTFDGLLQDPFGTPSSYSPRQIASKTLVLEPILQNLHLSCNSGSTIFFSKYKILTGPKTLDEFISLCFVVVGLLVSVLTQWQISLWLAGYALSLYMLISVDSYSSFNIFNPWGNALK